MMIPSSLLARYSAHLSVRARSFVFRVLVVLRGPRRLCGSHRDGTEEARGSTYGSFEASAGSAKKREIAETFCRSKRL